VNAMREVVVGVDVRGGWVGILSMDLEHRVSILNADD
jgi:hypothetical protein